MRESKFERDTIRKIKDMFPGCIVLKNDASYLQGIPDRLILFENMWAMLEFKRDVKAAEQPNQAYYVEKLNEMSFAAFIFPANEKEVLHGLQVAFGTRR